MNDLGEKRLMRQSHSKSVSDRYIELAQQNRLSAYSRYAVIWLYVASGSSGSEAVAGVMTQRRTAIGECRPESPQSEIAFLLQPACSLTIFQC